MNRFQTTKFYALCRYIFVRDTSSVDLISSEIKTLFKQHATPYDSLLRQWIAEFENEGHERRQQHVLDILLENPQEHSKFKFEMKPEPKNQQKVKFFIYCRAQLSLEPDRIIEEVGSVFRNCDYRRKVLLSWIKQFTDQKEVNYLFFSILFFGQN